MHKWYQVQRCILHNQILSCDIKDIIISGHDTVSLWGKKDASKAKIFVLKFAISDIIIYVRRPHRQQNLSSFHAAKVSGFPISPAKTE